MSFPLYALPEEHQMLRETVRALADEKIAPRAAEADETGEFPWDVYKALVAADLHAVHVPEEYGGRGPTPSRPSLSSRRWRGPARRPR